MSLRLKKIAKEVIVTLVLGVVLMTVYNLYLQKDMPSGMAPPLSAVQLNGERVDLQNLSEKGPVLVYFWASWCQVCSWVSPAVSDLSEDYQVITVAIASGNDDRVRRYTAAKELKFPVINDNEGELSRTWKVNVTPSIFIIKEGDIKSVTTGFTTKAGMLLRLWFDKSFG
jgi:thiol-disulfide isomerase/thioredoxin